MAISIVGMGGGSVSTTGNQSLIYGAGNTILDSGGANMTPAVGDLMILTMVHAMATTANRTLAQLAPITAGWSAIPGMSASVQANDSNAVSLAVFYRVVQSGDTGVTIPGAAASTNGIGWELIAIRGADTTTPFAGVAFTQATGSNTGLANPPSVSTPASPSGCLVAGSFGAATAAGTAFTNTGATPYDAAFGGFKSNGTATGTNRAVAGWGSKSGLGVSTAFDAAITGSTTTNTGSWAAVSYVIAPYDPIKSAAATLNGAATMSPDGTVIANVRSGFEAPTTSLPTATGVDKHSFLTVSNLTGTMNNSPNGSYCLRVDTGKTGKRRFGIRVNGRNSTAATPNGTISLGVSDNVADLSAGSFQAGSSTLAGWSIRLKIGEANPTRFRNGGSAVTNLSVATDVGDRYAIEFDTTANTVSLFHCPVSTGVWSFPAICTDTLTSNIPSGNWYAVVGGYLTGDSFSIHTTRNGMSADPSSGFVPYDDTVYNSTLTADATIETPTGPATYTVTAGLSGAATIAGNVSVVAPVASGLNGTATIAADARIYAPVASALNGTATIGASVLSRMVVNAALNGAATISANALVYDPVAATLTGSATLSATISTVINPVASGLTASGVLTGAITNLNKADAALTGSGVVAGNIIDVISVASAMTASGVLSSTITDIIPVASALNAAATIAADARVYVPAAASLSGAAVATVNADIVVVYNISSALNGTAILAGDIKAITVVSSAMQGNGITGGDLVGIIPFASAMTASATMTSAITNINVAASSLNANATIAADAKVYDPVSASLTSSGILAANATIIIATVTYQASASLNGTAMLTGDITARRVVQASLVASGTMLVDASLNGLQSGNAALTASATVNANVSVIAPVAVAMTSSANVGADARAIVASGAVLSASGVLGSGVSVLVPVQAPMASGAIVGASTEHLLSASASLASSTNLNTNGFLIMETSSIINSAGVIVAPGYIYSVRRPIRSIFWT